ncbi:hypothetical protein Avbf_08510 [Armadillidium vulgare]|nr:hypothetical protein Avbf_08510 [Armadillidium vulgare]
MHDWIAKLRESIELIRNNNRPTKGVKAQQNKRDSQGLPTEENQQQKQNLGVRTDGTVASTDVVDAKVTKVQEEFKTKQEFTSSLKKTLKTESSDIKSDEKISEREILEDDDDKKTVLAANIPLVKKISSTKISLQNPSLSLDTKPQLESITKNRIRGPAGRRAPQLRRTMLMKERASSMSALQQEGLTDNDARSETSRGIRSSTLTADGVLLAGSPSPNLSKSSGMTLTNNDLNASFDDIESALFFRRPSPLREEPSEIQSPTR